MIGRALLVAVVLLCGCRRQRYDCHLDRRLVFARAVPAGTRLTADDVSSRGYRFGSAPEALREDAYPGLLGRHTLAAHRAEEPIRAGDLVTSPLPQEGLRTVRLDGDFGLDLEPGDLVDVTATATHWRDGPVAVTALQAVHVLRAEAGQVWLQVLAEEAELLAVGTGSLALTQRAAGDCEPVEPSQATVNTLLTGERPRLRHPPLRHRPIQVIRGAR
jgi:Flp pilus assembly protein CpaB